MKKRLLFVIPSLTAGGGEKSLISLLSQIDYSQFEVDLFLFSPSGLFVDMVPKQVNVLPLPPKYREFTQPFVRAVRRLVSKGHHSVALNRMMFSLRNRSITNNARREQYNWKYLASSLDGLPGEYDAAIGFMEKTSIYFCVDKVQARKKIGWIHIDYDKMGMDPDFDRSYFKNLDHIVTVSEECADILKKHFSEMEHKISVIYNIVSESLIRTMAQQVSRDLYDRHDGETIVLSVGRLHYQKNFEMAVEACAILRDRGHQVKWYIIGEGEEREQLERLIQQYDLSDRFFLLGLRANPYPYINQADIYVQSSRFEGKSIAIDEAKILHKPIVVTNYPTASDQIENNLEGLIIEMSPEGIAEGIESLILDKQLGKRLSFNLSQLHLCTEEEIHKLYALLKI